MFKVPVCSKSWKRALQRTTFPFAFENGVLIMFIVMIYLAHFQTWAIKRKRRVKRGKSQGLKETGKSQGQSVVMQMKVSYLNVQEFPFPDGNSP